MRSKIAEKNIDILSVQTEFDLKNTSEHCENVTVNL